MGCHRMSWSSILTAPVILLRNIDPANRLCNGTRPVVHGFQSYAIDAKNRAGATHAGKRIFLPRIPLCPSDDEMFIFQFKRKRFPIRLRFAMTVNKAQGHTIPNVGIYLPEPVFSHGQLYVSLSRSTTRNNVKSLAVPPIKDKKKRSLQLSLKRSLITKYVHTLNTHTLYFLNYENLYIAFIYFIQVKWDTKRRISDIPMPSSIERFC